MREEEEGGFFIDDVFCSRKITEEAVEEVEAVDAIDGLGEVLLGRN